MPIVPGYDNQYMRMVNEGSGAMKMRRNGSATPEQLAILAAALHELGADLPLGSAERETLAAEIMVLFENGIETLGGIKGALSRS